MITKLRILFFRLQRGVRCFIHANDIVEELMCASQSYCSNGQRGAEKRVDDLLGKIGLPQTDGTIWF